MESILLNNRIRIVTLFIFIVIVSILIIKIEFPNRRNVKLILMFDSKANTKLSKEIKNFCEELSLLTNIDVSIDNYNDLKRMDTTFNESKILREVSDGSTYSMVFGSAYYWLDTIPESVFFAAVPFGMHQEALSLWTEEGADGRKEWENIYLNRKLNLIPFPFGQTGDQWGGISSVKIENISDFKGIYFRMPGLAKRIFENLGGKPFEKGFNINTQKISEYAQVNYPKKFIDWIGPAEDRILIINKWKFSEGQNRELFYYMNGWHERSTLFELLINKNFYASLDNETQKRLKALIDKYNYKILSFYPSMNELEYEKIRYNEEKNINKVKITFLPFPKEIMDSIYSSYTGVLENHELENDNCKRIRQKYDEFMKENDRYYKFTLRELRQ